ncbi:uncharacterized protein BYT42DRAFT_580270 [Radiomyces spectabilis]|uniref:uncharacterized protein n=1 Tax=Radiomyces spectabilis TaxID=64574 RepID=UPI0022208E06|nr:uncharacterized protein BYT42DRAFT_580270 [Radiomyces spectabilis]KAI8371444.1 hypothetical protein BYT42DRAFT_580270 [Radiomyces spectabilis]
MNNTPPETPHSLHSPNRKSTFSSAISVTGGLPTVDYPQPRRTTGEALASLVGASLTIADDTVYLFGGFDQYSDEVYNSLYKLNTKNDQCEWVRVLYTKGRLPSKRNDHTATLWNDNKLVIFGGYAEEDGRYCNDVAILELDTMTWVHPPTYGEQPAGRVRHSATIYKDKLYIAGGFTVTNQIPNFADTLLILDLTTWEWQTPIKFVRRSQHTTFMYNSRLYLFGGLKEDMSRSNHLSFIDLEQYNVTHLEIDSPSAPPLTGQRFSQICGDQLIVVVTQPYTPVTKDALNTGVWCLDFSSMQWQYHELGGRYNGCHWTCFAMAEHGTSFYLFGPADDEPDEFYAMALRVDIKELGLIPVPPSQLGYDLATLLSRQSQCTDFALRSSSQPEAGEIRAHRLVLLARWPYFLHMMNSNMMESVSNTLTLPEPFSTLESFVQFLYTDTIDDAVPDTVVADLMVMANIYMLPRLLALCVRRLQRHIDVENVSKIYHCAGLAAQRALQHTALQFIFRYFGAVSRTKEFRALPRESLFQVWDEMPYDAMIVGDGQEDVSRQIKGNQMNGQHETGQADIEVEEDEELEEEDDEGANSPMES